MSLSCKAVVSHAAELLAEGQTSENDAVQTDSSSEKEKRKSDHWVKICITKYGIIPDHDFTAAKNVLFYFFPVGTKMC